MYYQDVSNIFTVETKVFYSVNKLHFFVDKIYVKLRLFLTFVLSFFSFKSKACDLSPYLKIELFKKTPYKVEDIVCSKKNNHTYTFFIRGGTTSRKQQAKFIKKILKDSGIEVSNLIVDQNGNYKWTISNQKYRNPSLKRVIAKTKKRQNRKVKKAKRNIASVKPKRKPASTEKKTGKPDTQALYFGVYSGSASISSTDNTSGAVEKAVSDLGFGIHVSWSHLWSENLSYFVVGSLKKYSFKVSAGRTLSNPDVKHGYIGTGLNIKLGSRMTVTPALGLGESLILTSTGSSSLEIKKASIPAASLSTKIDLVKFKSGFNFYTNLRLGALAPSKQSGYETEFGHYGQVGVGSSFNAWGTRLNINSSYTQRKIDVGTASQESKDLGISIGVGWSY